MALPACTADFLYSLRQMINLLLPDIVCNKVTSAKFFLNGAIPCFTNYRESFGPIDSIRI